MAVGFGLTLWAIPFTLASCNKQNKTEEIVNQEQYQRNQEKHQEIIDKAYIVERDGCEYIIATGYRRGYLAHKGDCKNHSTNKN